MNGSRPGLQAIGAGLQRYRSLAMLLACCMMLLLSYLTIGSTVARSSLKPRVKYEATQSKQSIFMERWRQQPQQKIVVWTMEAFSGGPEALFQLAFALHDRGFNVYRTSNLVSVLRSQYPEWEQVPFLSWDTIQEHVVPGDTIVVPEALPIDSVPKFKGVRLVRWILAGVHEPNPEVIFLHHTFYLARANKSPASTVVMPYIHPNRTGFREGMFQLEAKRNTICLDNDARAVADLIKESRLRCRFEDDSLEVKVIEGMNFTEVEALYRRCKVVIDKGLPGMERVPLEAASFGAIVLLDEDPSNSIGSEWLDFPIPAEYVGSWTVDRLESTLYKALTSYEQEMKKFRPLRDRIAGMKAPFLDAVDKVFGQAATFLVPCTKPNDGPNCLRAAISALLISPLSMVRIITREDEAAFMAAHADLYQVLRDSHMDGLVTAGPMDPASEFAELASGAPNFRVILMPPDMVLVNADGLRAQSKHKSSSGHICMLWVPTGLKVDFLGEPGLPGMICPTLETSFEDFSSVEKGHFTGDSSHLHRFSKLCSSPIWKTVMQVSSQSWVQFCTSIERSSR